MQSTVAPRRLHRSYRGQFAVAAVKPDRLCNVEIRHPISIGETERVFVLQIFRDTLQSATSHGAVAGIDQCHAPRFGVFAVHLHLVVGHTEGDIRHVQKVVGEIFLDDVALVAAADHEIVHAMRRIHLHDVPQNRLATHFDHRFRPQVRLLRDAGSQASRKDHGFHAPTASADAGSPAQKRDHMTW